VVWNLLSNAVKFTPAGGKVRISIHQVNSEVELKVADTGQGIKSEFLPFVFDRFRQADSTTTRRHGGLGLGLAIARHLIEIHGGSIQAESPGEGQGATFTVRLPIIGSVTQLVPEIEPAAADKESFKSPSGLEGLHVLIVDDDKDTLELLGAALKQRDATVTAAQSVAEAMKAIAVSKPDVLVSDIAMPDQDGYELIHKLIAMNSDPAKRIPAVAITAYAKEEDKERALTAGYQSYLAKPIELSEFVAAVAEAAKNNKRTKPQELVT
jgi:CheY-like chemotaxis protein